MRKNDLSECRYRTTLPDARLIVARDTCCARLKTRTPMLTQGMDALILSHPGTCADVPHTSSTNKSNVIIGVDVGNQQRADRGMRAELIKDQRQDDDDFNLCYLVS